MMSKMLIVFALLCASATAYAQSPSKLKGATASAPLNAASTGAGNTTRAAAEEKRAQFRSLSQRRAALQNYLASVSPESADYQVTEKAIRELDARIKALESEFVSTSQILLEADAAPLNSTAPASTTGPRLAGNLLAGATLSDAVTPPDGAALAPLSPQDTLQDCSLFKDNPKTFSLLEKYACNLASDLRRRRRSNRQAGLNIPDDTFRLGIVILGRKDRAPFLVEAEESRVDKQVGSTPGANQGSTSLVVKGGAPAVIGFAVEHGGLTQDINGTTVTFRGNPIGLINAFSGLGLVESYDRNEKDPVTRLLNKISFALSFDVSQGSEPGVFTARRQQLSSWSGRVEFINERDPRNKKYQALWENFLADEGLKLTASGSKLVDILRERVLDADGNVIGFRFRDEPLQNWFKETNDVLKTTDDAQLETVLKDRLSKLPVTELSVASVTALDKFSETFEAYLKAKDDILKEIAKGTVVTFEYTNDRHPNAVDTSNLRFIAETGFLQGRADLSANASITLFNSKPTVAGTGRVRDFQFASQVDVPFGNTQGLGKFVFSFAGRYERLAEDATTDAGTVMPNTKGDIGVGQFKLTIPVRGTGLKIPISFTFANRTELIKEREVRGNFGFTFDLDTIFAKFKPF